MSFGKVRGFKDEGRFVLVVVVGRWEIMKLGLGGVFSKGCKWKKI